MKIRYFLFSIALVVIEANADSSTLDAAIGGGIGGAAGAAIGNEIGGRDGAIIGGALGGAVGVVVNTADSPSHYSPAPEPEYRYRSKHKKHKKHSYYYHCPPGQGKKAAADLIINSTIRVEFVVS